MSEELQDADEQPPRKPKTWAEIRAAQKVAKESKNKVREEERAEKNKARDEERVEIEQQVSEARAVGQWWAGIPKSTVAVNVRYLNVKTPTKSMGMGTLKVTEDGLRWRSNIGPKVSMPRSEIEVIDVDGETTRGVTAGRVLTLGVFALAAKKDKRNTHMTVVTQKGEFGFLFEKTAPEVIKTKLRPVLTALSTTQSSTEGGSGVEGIADELKKLADLRDAGILTEEEFIVQKAKLL